MDAHNQKKPRMDYHSDANITRHALSFLAQFDVIDYETAQCYVSNAYRGEIMRDADKNDNAMAEGYCLMTYAILDRAKGMAR